EGFLVAIPFLVKVLFEDQKVRKLIAGLTVLASVPAFAVYAYTQTGNILAPFQSEASASKCTILCFFNNQFYEVRTGVLPYTINLVAIVLSVIFVVRPLVRGTLSTKLLSDYLWV